MSDMIRVSICDGKYTIVQNASGRTSVLRHGDAWRDVTGDNVILGAAYEIENLRDKVAKLEAELAAHTIQIPVGIPGNGDPDA